MKLCKVEGCNQKHKANGFCNRHNIQVKRHGKITDEVIELLPGEIWANVQGNDGYKISNYGRIVNCSRKKLLKIIEVDRKSGFYMTVKLGEKISIPIHTAIAKAFIPNTANDTQVEFLDGDRRNVQLGNIQWKSLYRRDAFMDRLKNDSSDMAKALLKYIGGKPKHLDCLIAQQYRNLKATAYYQLSKSNGYSYNFERELANDALQEGLLRGLLALSRGMLNDIDNFFGWLATIIRNAAKNIMNIERRYTSENQMNSDGEEFSLITSGLV